MDTIALTSDHKPDGAGGAAQIRVESAWLQRLKLQYQATSLTFALNLNLRPLSLPFS